MSEDRKTEVANVVPTSKGLQSALIEEMNSLRQGRTTPQSSRAVGSLVGYLIQLKRLEIDFARFIADARTDVLESDESAEMKSIAFG